MSALAALLGGPWRAVTRARDGLSLRARLTLAFLLVTAVAAGSVGALMDVTARPALTAAAGGRLTDLAESTGVAVGDMLARQVDSLQTLAAGEVLQRAAERQSASYPADERSTPDELQRLELEWTGAAANDPLVQRVVSGDAAEQLSGYQSSFPENVEVFITDDRGALVAATGRTQHYRMDGELWWQSAYANGRGGIFVDQPRQDAQLGSWSVLFAVPIHAHGGEQVVGVAAAVARMTTLDVLLRQGRFGESGRAELLLPDNTLFSESAGPGPALDPALSNALRSGRDHVEWTLSGQDALLSLAPVRSIRNDAFVSALNWSVLISQDRAEALAPVNAAGRAALLGLFAALLLVAVSAVAIAHTISAPIEQIMRTAQRVAAGDLSARSQLYGSDEIGELALSLNSMTTTMRLRLEGQEAQAAGRLHALQEALAAVQSTLDLDEVLRLIATAVTRAGYRAALLAIYDENARALVVRAASTQMPQGLPGLEALLGGTSRRLSEQDNIAVRAFVGDTALVSHDLRDFLAPQPAPPASDAARELRCGAALPLRSAGRPVGTMLVFSSQAEFGPQDLLLLQTFGDHAGVAVDKARLFTEVRQARDRLQLVLDAAHDGVALFDTGGRLVLVNPAVKDLLGLDLSRRTDPAGERSVTFDDLRALLGVTDDSLEAAAAQLALSRTAVRRRTVRVERPQRVLDEALMPVYDSTVALPGFQNPERGLRGWLAVWHDVTHEKALEQAREDLTHMLVHDLRSPLNSVLGGLALAQDVLDERNDVEDEALRQMVRLSTDGSRHLLDLINSILDVYKLESGTFELDLQPVALNRLVEQVSQELAAGAAQAGVKVIADVPGDLPRVLADPQQLSRILTNLLDNALKFTPAGKEVRIRARREDGRIAVAVADQGPGIPPEYRGRIFDKFVQVPGGRPRRRGTGLGLTFVKLAVEAHGGRVAVDCPAEGGTVFTFDLPLAEVEAQA